MHFNMETYTTSACIANKHLPSSQTVEKYPYCVSVVQKLEPPDYPQCLAFCDWLLGSVKEGGCSQQFFFGCGLV